MKTTWLITDTHFNHDNIATYCDRPKNFTDLIIERWNQVVHEKDLIIHLGDVAIGNRRTVKDILSILKGRKVLILGNHDRQHGPDWWMEQGFSFACQAMKYRNCWLTHEPATSLADGCDINIHGHLHNFWEGFNFQGRGIVDVSTGKAFTLPTKLNHFWQRLLAVEYTNYFPVNFDKFVAHPAKYHATGKEGK